MGKAIKKGAKQISLKNIVKVGTPFLSMIPLVGSVAQSTVENISASAEAKKQARNAERDGNLAQAEALHLQSDILAQQSGALIGQQAGSVLKAFTKGATTEVVAQVSESTKVASGIIGASVVDSTVKEWFTLHWKMLVGALVGVIVVFKIWKKQSHPSRKRWNAPVNKTRYAR